MFFFSFSGIWIKELHLVTLGLEYLLFNQERSHDNHML